MRKVPDFAKVSKQEYTHVRNFVRDKATIAGFDVTGTWNLVISELEKRHANVVKGRAKNELTLQQAAEKVIKAAFEERMKIERERAEAEAVPA